MEQLRSAYPNSIPQCVSLMLSKWQITLEEYGIQTTPTLANALRDAERADLADDLSGSPRNCHSNPICVLSLPRSKTRQRQLC
jgi:hypothetical protein